MTTLHVMQRANGDLFAFDSHGRTTVPLFNNGSEAMAVRLHNPELLLFKPVQLDPVIVRSLLSEGDATYDFLLVEAESLNLKRGLLINQAQLLLRVGLEKNCGA